MLCYTEIVQHIDRLTFNEKEAEEKKCTDERNLLIRKMIIKR